MKRLLWYALKKLPIILAVLMAPLTVFVVLHLQPDIKSFFKLPERKEPAQNESVRPASGNITPGSEKTAAGSAPAGAREALGSASGGAAEWEARAARCVTADDYAALAQVALDADEISRSRIYFLEALRLDPDHEEAHLALGDVRFDPVEHLDGFAVIAGGGDSSAETELQFFRNLEGEWLTGTVLTRIRNRWEDTRARLGVVAGDPPVAATEAAEAAAVPDPADPEPGDADLDPAPDPKKTPDTGPDPTGGPDPETGRTASGDTPRHGDAPPHGETPPGDRTADPGFLSRGEVLELIAPGVRPGVFRSVCHYLVVRDGLFEAEQALNRQLEEVGVVAGESVLDEDRQRLRDAVAFVQARFGDLAAGGHGIRLGQEEVRPAESRPGFLICAPASGNPDPARLPDGCRIGEQGLIECPWKAMDLDYVLGRFKSLLDATGEEDRIAYALCQLHRADGTAFRRELGRVADGNPAKGRLLEVYPLYEEAEAGGDLIALMAGEIPPDPDETVESAVKLLRRLDDSDLLNVLDRSRLEAILSHLLYRKHLHRDAFLRSAYRGFRESSLSTDTFRFAYDFSDRDQRLDFDSVKHPLADEFAARLGAAKVLAPKPFQIKSGGFACYGTDFLVLDPVFTGQLEASLSLRFNPKREKKFREPYYVCFGYGLRDESLEGYGLGDDAGHVASVCLKGLEVSGAAPGSGPCPGNLRADKSYTVVLTGDSLEITHEFNGSITHIDGNGIRTGRIFVWVSGPRWFEIDKLEVRAGIDPGWLRDRIAPLVEKELRRILL